jgi:hypothetical protein
MPLIGWTTGDADGVSCATPTTVERAATQSSICPVLVCCRESSRARIAASFSGE